MLGNALLAGCGTKCSPHQGINPDGPGGALLPFNRAVTEKLAFNLLCSPSVGRLNSRARRPRTQWWRLVIRWIGIGLMDEMPVAGEGGGVSAPPPVGGDDKTGAPP